MEYYKAVLTSESGQIIEIPQVSVELSVEYPDREYDWGRAFRRNRAITTFTLKTTGDYTITMPPELTRAEKIAKLVRERYDQEVGKNFMKGSE